MPADKIIHAPFRAFILSLENGDRVTVEHPENVDFEPESESTDFYVMSRGLRRFGDFEAVTSVPASDVSSIMDRS